ncbi:glycerate kinase [Caloranaerobacter azorensis]|nr:glycerate kinase [Caloranaerobacter azorensis]
MMNILIAPDSFKGSLTSKQYCDICEEAIKSVIPNAKIIKYPLADGGEGTVEALVLNTKGKIKHTTVQDPLGNPIEAKYGILGDGKTGVIEMASASGLTLIPTEKRNPFYTSTYGTGQLVLKLLDEGCTHIIMGIGGSATNDGGAGMMEALGFELLNDKGEIISRGAKGLLDLHSIDISNRDKRIDNVKFTIACDVTNPLCGPNGASYVYGLQKGAKESDLPILDKALENFAKVVKKELGVDILNIEGAGAAGGLGGGLLAFLNAELKRGFDIISEAVGIEKAFQKEKIDLVITGEGQINYQTVNNKLPVGIAKLAKKYNVPVLAIVGSIGEGYEKVYEFGINSVFSIVDKPETIDYAINNADKLLFSTVKNVFSLLKSFEYIRST